MKRFLFTGASLLVAITPALAQTADKNDTIADVQSTTLLSMVAAAGWVMIPLALGSMVAFTLIVYCFMTLREKSITSP